MEKLLQSYIDKADIRAEDTRDVQVVQVIAFMMQSGIVQNLTYQRFVTMLAQLKKIVFAGA